MNAREEVGALVGMMSGPQRRAWIYLGRLYLERQASPSRAVDVEIARIECAIRDGFVPSVPRTH